MIKEIIKCTNEYTRKSRDTSPALQASVRPSICHCSCISGCISNAFVSYENSQRNSTHFSTSRDYSLSARTLRFPCSRDRRGAKRVLLCDIKLAVIGSLVYCILAAPYGPYQIPEGKAILQRRISFFRHSLVSLCMLMSEVNKCRCNPPRSETNAV